MRLIDADALKEKILKERDAIPMTVKERYSFGCEVPNRHGASMRGGIRKALRCVEQTPTIEAEPVRHGRWEQWKPKYIGMEYSYDTMVCSVCEFKMGNAKIIPAHYCPNCGAKMDSEV